MQFPPEAGAAKLVHHIEQRNSPCFYRGFFYAPSAVPAAALAKEGTIELKMKII